MIEIHIPLPPIPWTAPLKGKYGFYDPKEVEKRCARYFIKEHYLADPIDTYTALTFKFTFKPPPSTTKKRRYEMLAGKILPTRCDCTNLQKLYEDCLKGLIITDDRNVAKIFSEKLYGEKDEIVIKVYTLEEFNHVYSYG